ncbi:hypothetical protein Trydic_g11641 [Trypoxylus dichotomus]
MALLYMTVPRFIQQTLRGKLDDLGWEVIELSLYSPNFSPGRFHLFRSFKEALGDQHFEDKQTSKAFVLQWLQKHSRRFYDESIEGFKSVGKVRF